MQPYSTQKCRYGTLLYLSHDNTIGRSLSLYGEWSEPEAFVFAQMLHQGDVVVEAGANIGSHTVMLSAAVGEQGIVHAFEPQRHAFQLLCANAALNQRTNVHAHHAALGDETGSVAFPSFNPRDEINFGAVSLHLNWDNLARETVPIHTLDSLQLPRLDFLKADVEGFEINVLRGARQTIAQHRPLMHLEYINPYSDDISAHIFEIVAAMDYRLWFYITPLFNSLNYLEHGENVFPGLWSFDLICIPREKGQMLGVPEMTYAGEKSSCNDIEAWRQARYERAPSS